MKSVITGDSEIKVLDLSWNHIRRKGAVAIAEGLKVLQANLAKLHADKLFK